MGGTPAFAMLSMALSDSAEIMEFHESVKAECQAYGLQVIGGDISRQAEGNVYSLSILGFVEKERLKVRSGAQNGDSLFACGSFGRSFPTEWHLDFTPLLKEGRALSKCPEVHAMMDVSDGLLKDTARMAEASGLAFSLDPEQIPRRDQASLEEALCDGEDYALLFAAPESFVPPVPAVKIGRFLSGEPGSWIGKIELTRKGFDHFS